MMTRSLSARQGKPATTIPDTNATCPCKIQLKSLLSNCEPFWGKMQPPATDTGGRQDLGETKVCQGHLELSLESLILLHIPSFRDHLAKIASTQRRKKEKHSLAAFEPKKSHLLSMARDTNKNLVSFSAGTFSRRVGFHLDDTLGPICLPYFPGAAKCWGGVSVLICEFPTPCSLPLE